MRRVLLFNGFLAYFCSPQVQHFHNEFPFHVFGLYAFSCILVSQLICSYIFPSEANFF